MPNSPAISQKLCGFFKRYYEGDVLQAKQFFYKSLDLQSQRSSDENPKMIPTLDQLGKFYEEEGENLAAQAIYLEALKIQEKTKNFGKIHSPDIAENKIAKIFPETPMKKKEIQQKQGGDQLEQKLADREKDQLSNAQNLRRLGKFSENKQEYGKAKKYYKQALSFCQKSLGEKKVLNVAILTDLAGLYFILEEYDRANSIYQRALNMQQNLGGQGPETVKILNQIGEIYYLKNENETARGFFSQSLQIQEKDSRDSTPEMLRPLTKLSEIYGKKKDYVNAEAHIKKIILIQEREFGTQSLPMSATFNSLAGLYYMQKKYDLSERLYTQSFALRKRLLPPESAELSVSYNNLGTVFLTQKKYPQAEKFYQNALKIRRKVLGLEHPDVVSSLSNMGRLKYEQGRITDAEIFYVEAHNIRKKTLRRKHPELADSYAILGLIKEKQQANGEAKKLYARAIAIARSIVPPEDVRLKNYTSNYQRITGNNDRFFSNFKFQQKDESIADALFKTFKKTPERV